MINSRRKGKVAELEACRFLEGIIGGTFRRTQQHMGVSGAADIEGCRGLSIEVKARQVFNIYKSMAQAEASATIGQTPLVIYWNNRGDKMAIIKAKDLVEFSRTIINHVNHQVEMTHNDQPATTARRAGTSTSAPATN